MPMSPETTRLVIILCSILGGLILFFIPIGIVLYFKHKSMLAQQKRNSLQLNEEEFKKNIDYATHGAVPGLPKQKIYMNFNDEDMMDGVPKKFEN